MLKSDHPGCTSPYSSWPAASGRVSTASPHPREKAPLHANSWATYVRKEAMAAIPAVCPAVAMCPVVQKEIAKISAVPINRHVTAFAIVLRIMMLSSVCHWPSSVDPRGSCCAEFRGRSVELRHDGWTSHQAGPHTAHLLIILIDKILSTIESNC